MRKRAVKPGRSERTSKFRPVCASEVRASISELSEIEPEWGLKDDPVAADDELLDAGLNRTMMGSKSWWDPFTRLGHKDVSIEPGWN